MLYKTGLIVVAILVATSTTSAKSLEDSMGDVERIPGTPRQPLDGHFVDTENGVIKMYWFYNDIRRTFDQAQAKCRSELGSAVDSVSIQTIRERDHLNSHPELFHGFYWTSGRQTYGYEWGTPFNTPLTNPLVDALRPAPQTPLCIAFEKGNSINLQHCISPAVTTYTLCQLVTRM